MSDAASDPGADGALVFSAPVSDTPYAGLTPHAVLDALDAVGLRGDGRILQLNSYENRVFQVGLEDGHFVVAKFYRAGRWSDAQILEEHGFARELLADEIPVVAPLSLHAVDDTAQVLGEHATLARHGEWRFAVAPRCAGRSPELEDPAALEWIGRFLARIHLVGQRHAFVERPRLDGTSAARAAVDWLMHQERPAHGSADDWQQMALRALDKADALFAQAEGWQPLRLHGDCHVGNLLWREGPHFVDLDDCVTGPAVQDLWMLLGGERSEQLPQLAALVDGYEQLRDFDRRELRLIEALRTLRIIQHSAWIARRWHDPAFPIAFPSFESPAYWSQQATQLAEQLDAMDAPSLVV